MAQCFVRSKIVEALIYFDRLRRHKQPDRSTLSPRPRNIWNVVHYVHQHYREPLTLHDLAGFSYEARPSERPVQKCRHSVLRFLHG